MIKQTSPVRSKTSLCVFERLRRQIPIMMNRMRTKRERAATFDCLMKIHLRDAQAKKMSQCDDRTIGIDPSVG
jgi:hypothetical protein